MFFENFPAPRILEITQQPFIDLVDRVIAGKEKRKDTTAIEAEIDRLVYQLYGLTEKEIELVEAMN